MNEMARVFFIIGGIFLGVGLSILLAAKIPGIGRLPGDMIVKRENFTFYFPLATSILLSLVLSLIFYLIQKR